MTSRPWVQGRGRPLLRVVAQMAAASVLLAAVALALPDRAGAAGSHSRLRFGAYSPVDPTDGRTDTLAALQDATARRVDIVHWFQPWGSGDWIVSPQPALIEAVSATGRTPLITWEPWDPRINSPDQRHFGLAWIASGAYDALISEWAQQLRDTGRRVYLRPMHEMNGDWYPWAGSVNDNNDPQQYIAAWRHIVDIFRGQGAANVRFVWSPNHVDAPGNRMESFYPGSDYVDVLAADGYNWGAAMPQFGGWRAFGEIFRDAYARLGKLGSQPIWITEIGSAPEGGDKAAWVRDMFATAKRMRRLRAIVWFNVDKERDWRADSTPQVAAAFRPETRLRLRAARTVRVGQVATVRWRASRETGIASWKVTLNGHMVRVVAADGTRRLKVRVARRGRYHWRVTGYDARAQKIVSATRFFRAGGGAGAARVP